MTVKMKFSNSATGESHMSNRVIDAVGSNNVLWSMISYAKWSHKQTHTHDHPRQPVL